MNNLENLKWYSSLKKALKGRLKDTGKVYRILNLISSVMESDDKLFAIREAMLAPKYGQTGLNRQHLASLQRLADFLKGVEVDLVDVGAHAGWFIRISRRFFQVRNIYAYEPLVRYNTFLEPLRGDFPTLKIRNMIVGSEDGEKVFYHYLDGGNSSTRKYCRDYEAPIHARNSLVETTTLPATRLEDDLRTLETDKSRPLLLKIDVEGSEQEVLNGAKTLFNEGRVVAVLIEMQAQAIYENQTLWIDLLKFFDSHGLVLLDVLPIQRRPDKTVTVLDGIFVKRRDALKSLS